ncbi:glycoside hydrolase family protein [Prevotella melaninogenica]|uniref:glycoside hydrolase family protein n=1 Tax=Prevotella melaninogenica TaxID=28132 RepID=UPI001C600058|nr:glycoside hydrolase family protein [Prevotella melaninogenica]MBW4730156.1 glycoside hydrolase family protein [Prevotella melaninogenica]MBW4732830.1 glycoside hydrolase family protein [Prevotella melaninogenica]MBW4750112.1 glycoside hydrolase family protein [Prevotella melaninogenica]
MRTAKRLALSCIICLFCQSILAQRRVRLADLPPFERAVVVVKYFEGLHGKGCFPYVGYGHQLQPGEHLSSNMTERQADSLLRADLWKCFEYFKGYGKDALLLTLLAYNVGVGRLLGYGKHPKSRLLRKIESGDRNFYQEYVSFCRYKGKVLNGLVKRRKVEFALFFII